MEIEQLQALTNEALAHFHETHSEAQRDFLIEAFAQTGEIPTGEQFGITEAQAEVVVAGFVKTLEAQVFRQYGLTIDTWMEHVDETDEPEFRGAALRGDWQVFHRHAQQCARMRHKLGI